MKKIVLVDGHNLLFRMFYGIPSSIKNSMGMEIKGLVGFIGSLKRIVNEFNPYSLIVVFDSETSRDNNLLIDNSYKASRTDYSDVCEEDNPFSQLPLIKKALDYLGIFYLEVNGNEADDYIASLINRNQMYKYIIVSTDSDFIQLVNKNTYLYVPRGKNSILYDELEVIRKYNIKSNKYVLYKSLVGDKSDNILGVRGIGKVVASKILEYNSIEDYVFCNSTSRYSKMLLENDDRIRKNIKLIRMNKNVDVSSVSFHKLSQQLVSNKTYQIIDKIGEK